MIPEERIEPRREAHNEPGSAVPEDRGEHVLQQSRTNTTRHVTSEDSKRRGAGQQEPEHRRKIHRGTHKRKQRDKKNDSDTRRGAAEKGRRGDRENATDGRDAGRKRRADGRETTQSTKRQS